VALDRTFNVLFLCSANSARSILAEALLQHLGNGRVRAFSAGSFPKSHPHPLAIELLKSKGLAWAELRSKSWDEFAQPSAPAIDLVITVCDQAAKEVCPVWPGHPARVHWGIPDPAGVEGSKAAQAFETTYRLLTRRIAALAALPWEELAENLDTPALAQAAQAIADNDG
jgi:protein-tyrosine-phosphatase